VTDGDIERIQQDAVPGANAFQDSPTKEGDFLRDYKDNSRRRASPRATTKVGAVSAKAAHRPNGGRGEDESRTTRSDAVPLLMAILLTIQLAVATALFVWIFAFGPAEHAWRLAISLGLLTLASTAFIFLESSRRRSGRQN
jgi:hypothetical protein